MVTIFLRRGSVPDALAFVEPLARRNATNLALQALYADVLVRAQRYDDAWNAARRALRCDERYVPALKALVKASLRQGRSEMATTILDQALGIDDNDPELHFIKGTLLREEPGHLRDAMAQFERAIQLRPDYTEARMALGVQLLAGGRYTEALAHFQAAANLAPTLVPVHLNLADAYRATKQWEKAKAEFDRVLRMDGNNAQAHFNMGLMYMSAGAEFPGLDALQALQKAKQEFTAYRNQMGPRLPRNDPSEGYLSDLDRQIDRTQRRIERDRARAQRNAERAARAAEGGTE
jgi:tetratricopeptide (TPR) repeat protein